MMTSSAGRPRSLADGLFRLSEFAFVRCEDLRAIKWILASKAPVLLPGPIAD